MQHVVQARQSNKIHYPGIEVSAYDSGDDFASASTILVAGSHDRIRSTASDRIYFVLQGSGWFEVEGVTTPVADEDAIFLPRNTVYAYGGTMRLFLVHSPGFQAGTDQKMSS
jgi:mannose-6-phosphate isomerase-like protein (cupin superfamily)